MGALIVVVMTGCTTPMEVETVNDKEIPLKSAIEAFGVVKSDEITSVTISFAGEVMELLVKPGDLINQGTPLVTLNLDELEYSILQKEMQLKAAQLEVSKAKKEVNGSKNNESLEIKKSLNTLQYLEVHYDQEVRKLEEQKELLNLGSISKLDYELYEKQVKEIKKSVEDLQYHIEGLKGQLNTAEVQLEILEVKASLIEGELLQLKDKLKIHNIINNQLICDIGSALVSEVMVNQGDIIQPGATILRLVNMDQLYMEAEIPEEFIKDVKIGARATMIPLADKDLRYEGKVIGVSSMAIVKNGETIVPIKISFQDPNGFLLPNFNIDVIIDINN